ncbi:HAD family acid phosphatase [Nitrospirillum sp. BR 11164]|uniref:HAD family acid phosphatase n=1 Tax=Nitrospirillum sp. BR 11164 TaxID=3104324 RepID=UPI002AFDD2C9|nr:HAD family acid phosphatase [Nitrospirillum sp. BR 11164]MEA1651718.1 HAD family acid phosphatase [Nitrospirillum sp. BR 11164]
MFVRAPVLVLFLALFLTTLAGCANQAAPVADLPNLGVVKTQLVAYHDSGAYDRDLARVAGQAGARIKARVATLPVGSRPALVLDIDETSLSNWPQLKINDFGYIKAGGCDLDRGPCAAPAWEMMGRATVIAPTLELYRQARAAGVAVFFITGRPEGEREATARNLAAAGYEGWAGLVLRAPGAHGSAADYKAAERAKIEAQGYTIIANMGDQDSDLAGGHAERTFKLANPFYFIP